MQIEGAIIEEQNQKFAIVIVKSYVLSSISECNQARSSFEHYFPGIPIILMAQDHRGIPTYQGRKDIVAFLANIDMARISWQRFTFS